MSTHGVNVELSCQNGVNFCAESCTFPKSPGEEQRQGSSHDGNGNELNGTPPTHLQSTKNLFIERRINVKSRRYWDRTPEDHSQNPEQPSFTSCLLLRFLPKRSEEKVTDDNPETLHRTSDEVKKAANAQQPKTCEKSLPLNGFKQPADKAPEDEDVPDSLFGKDGVACSRKNSPGPDIFSHGSTKTESQLGLELWHQTTEKCLQRQSGGSEPWTKLPVTESATVSKESGVNDPHGGNAEGVVSYSNLIPLQEDSSSKAGTDCRPHAHSSGALKRTLSLPSFPTAQHCIKLETEPSCTSPPADMFTSTLVSVLAPHWSGRLRRNKRGVSDVEDTHVSGQNVSLPLSGQDALQPHSSIQAGGEVVDEFNKRLKRPLVPSKSYVDWQKASKSSNPTANFHSKRPVGDSNVEFSTPGPLSQDSDQVLRSPLSSQPIGLQSFSQAEDKGNSFSPTHSRPTTSSLLLSLRKLKARNVNAESTLLDEDPSTPVTDQILPSKSILRVSQPQSSLVAPVDLSKVAHVPCIYPTNSENCPSPDKSSISPTIREIEQPRKPLLLGTAFRRDGQFSGSSPKLSQPQTAGVLQRFSKEVPERKYSHIGSSGSRGQSITDCTNLSKSNIKSKEHRTCISPRDNTNSNFIFPQTEFNNRNLNSHNQHMCDNVTKRQESPMPTKSLNLRSSTYLQSNSTFNTADKGTVNKPSISTSTTTFASHKNTNIINSSVNNSSAALKSRPMIQTSQNSIQNPNTTSFGPDKLPLNPSNSLTKKTFTNSLVFTPRKDPSAVEGRSTCPARQDRLNSQSNQTSPELTSTLSPSRPLRGVRVPSIYSYLRENSPQTSPFLSSSSPQTQSLKEDVDKNAETLMFTFDSSPKPDLCTSSPVQSLSPDVGRRLRHNSSPYATLISSRPALNSTLYGLSSPPGSCQHSRSASYDGLTTPPNKSLLTSPIHKNALAQGSSEDAAGSDKLFKSKTRQTSAASLDTYHVSKKSPDTKLMGYKATNVIQKSTPQKRSDTVIKNVSSEGLNGRFSYQSDNGRTYAPQGLKSKDPSSPQCTGTVTETEVKGPVTLQTPETLQESPSSKSKVFSLRSKKDNVHLSTSAPADKEGLDRQYTKKGEMKGLKSSNRMDLMFNRLKMTLGVKRSEDEDDNDVTVRRTTKNLNQQPSDFKTSGSTKRREGLESQSMKSLNLSNSKILAVSESCSAFGPVSGLTLKTVKHETIPHVVEDNKRMDEIGNSFLDRQTSPHRPKSQYNHRYATLPLDRRSTPGVSPTVYSFEFDSMDPENDDNVFYYYPTKRKTPTLSETETVPDPASTTKSRRHPLNRQLSSSCADLKYGLERVRSVSVSSVISGRPSGPGRISTGSRTSSVSDLASLDEFRSRSSRSSLGSQSDSPGFGVPAPTNYSVQNTFKVSPGGLASGGHLQSPVNLETSSYPWDTVADPPSPSRLSTSPIFSPTVRQMAQVPSPSPTGSRTSQDSMSPRGFLPSKNYKSTLSAFEESSSETTTDDEYYFNSDDDDEKETEL